MYTFLLLNAGWSCLRIWEVGSIWREILNLLAQYQHRARRSNLAGSAGLVCNHPRISLQLANQESAEDENNQWNASIHETHSTTYLWITIFVAGLPLSCAASRKLPRADLMNLMSQGSGVEHSFFFLSGKLKPEWLQDSQNQQRGPIIWVADKVTYYPQWTWLNWVVPYRLWRFVLPPCYVQKYGIGKCGPLSVVNVFAQIWTSHVHSPLL